MIFLVVLVTALLTVAAAHPHPMDLHGECMAMRTQHEGRQMFGVPMPNCLKGIQPPKSHINTMKQCAIMIKKKVIMVQKERLLSLSFDMEGMMGMVKEALSECLVEKMELVGEDDALNITKILQTVSEISHHFITLKQ
ncbi:uncharacterized protein LOC121863484 [Homarus americanus]|uniref:uncharacterized protein LOC121863484 n=1 Tax=Homarus americanus TaxID=6706 RepID=UPI001C4953DC|nr:uncharacterized protein LOC121863484 [Homarus americanus]